MRRQTEDAPLRYSPRHYLTVRLDLHMHYKIIRGTYGRCVVGNVREPQRFECWICLRLRVERELGEPTRMDPVTRI